MCTSGLDGLGHIFMPFTHGPAVSDTRCARPRGQALCIAVWLFRFDKDGCEKKWNSKKMQCTNSNQSYRNSGGK